MSDGWGEGIGFVRFVIGTLCALAIVVFGISLYEQLVLIPDLGVDDDLSSWPVHLRDEFLNGL